MENEEICGIECAAILVKSLNEDLSAEVIKYLSPKEIYILSKEMTMLDNVSREKTLSVLKNFYYMIKNNTGIAINSDGYLYEVLVKAFGKDNANNIIDRVTTRVGHKNLDTLRWMDSKAVAGIVIQEHPQIIATVLCYLDPDQSAEILVELPDKLRVDVIMRIAGLNSIQPSAIQDLDSMIEEQISEKNRKNLRTIHINGIQKAADILAQFDNSVETEILDVIKEKSDEIAEEIQDAMLVFEQLAYFSDKDIQTILREISSESLVLALKGSDEKIKDAIFDNLSKRAGNMLREDLENRGPVRLKDVETAKKEILCIVRKLAIAGDISLDGTSGEAYV